MSFKAKFQPSQIVCLECQTACLYAEVIQVVEERQLCWVRPIALVDGSVGNGESRGDRPQVTPQPILYDLREGADLLCPMALFQAALDTQVVPILTELELSKAETAGLQPIPSDALVSHQRLRAFIQYIWKTYPEAFRANSQP